jgi:hypothetical protein
VKCDEGHNIVVVVPSGAGISRTFWTGSGESGGFSSLICERVGLIRERGGSTLPLGVPEQDHLRAVLAKIPEGVGGSGLYVLEQNKPGMRDVIVYSLHGSRFNRVLALVLRGCLGPKVHVRSTDFMLRVSGAGKIRPGARVVSALESVREMSRDEIGTRLPLPSRETWKFAGLLPDVLFKECALADYYHISEFMDILSSLPITLLPIRDPPEEPSAD